MAKKRSSRKSHAEAADGPFVAVAAFCEHVLEEKDNVVSAIRIVDEIHVNVRGELPADLPAFPVPLPALLIVLRSGDLLGKQSVLVRHVPPTARVSAMQAQENAVEFTGGNQGVNMVLRFLSPAILEFGLHWFDVCLDDRVLTRVPIRIRLQQQDES